MPLGLTMSNRGPRVTKSWTGREALHLWGSSLLFPRRGTSCTSRRSRGCSLPPPHSHRTLHCGPALLTARANGVWHNRLRWICLAGPHSAIYLPVFYTFKAAFQGGIYDPVQAAVQGLHLYRANFVTDNAMSLMLWIPGDILCFTVPLQMRMPLSHALNVVFLSGLSALRGAQTVVVPTVNLA